MRYAIMGATVEQVRSVGGSDIKETKTTGIIFSTLTEEQVSRLKGMGCQVSLVGKVSTGVSPPVAPPVPVAGAPVYTPSQLFSVTGLDQLRSLSKPPLYGEGFNLALIDTGVRETHEKVKGRFVYSKNYTSNPMEDGFDHGTGVCSIALEVAPLCNILNLKVLDNKGEGTEEEVVLAIDDCIDFYDSKPEIAPSVINLSMGSPDDGDPSNILRVACRAAVDKGIWIAAAAGNSGPTVGTVMCPACERYVGAVGSIKYLASERTFVLSTWSSRGPTKGGLIKPDMVFFGEDLILASSASDTATVAKSGTSFSTPFMSAVAILFLEGYQRRAVPTEPIAGVHPELGIWIPVQDMIDKYLPGACIKPQGVAAAKDNDYGCGLMFGPLVLQALGLAPAAVDISALLGMVFVIGMMGVMIKTME